LQISNWQNACAVRGSPDPAHVATRAERATLAERMCVISNWKY
jgi:hypothetical protein